MRDKKNLYNIINQISPLEEHLAKEYLNKAGLYSKEQTFPLASLQFELTSHCNAACKHCYNNSGVHNSQPDAMTPERWISFAKYLVDHGGVFECLLSGGEPLLLGESLLRLMDILHEDQTLFLLQTNGSLLTRDVAKRLKKYRYHWLQISIDGVTAEYHDSFRQMRGSWERAVNAAISVATCGIPLKIAHCVTPQNINDIDDMCAFAYTLGASAITVGELCLSGRTLYNRELLLTARQRNYLACKVAENVARYKNRMIVKSSNSVRLGLIRQKESPASAALIRPNGDIRIDGMAPFVIGNVLTDDFAKVWEEKIHTCWSDPRVVSFLSEFHKDDRNYSYINFIDRDIYI